MTSNAEARLHDLGFTLPHRNDPVANYVPFTRAGNLVFIAGQTCKWDGELVYAGAVGDAVSVQDAVKAAELCALNLLLHLRTACEGDLDRVQACLKLTAFVHTLSGFQQHALIGNGASDLLVKVFGDKGRHARAAVGCASLPGNASVEIDGIFAIA